MIKIKKLSELSEKKLDKLFHRFSEDFSSIMIDTVIPIVDDVKKNGDNAVIKYTEKFDGIRLNELMVQADEIENGYNRTPKNVINAFLEAKNNIEDFHLRQKKKDIKYTREDGTILGIKYQPIEKAAVYVPGGKASYPSSVLMSVVPAKIAGTEDITIFTPPDNNGKINDATLAVCRILGINKIVKSGGAQGIAAAGLGTESVNKADIITGPGNIYVTAAKTYLYSLGVIQIDSPAGPSEILIISDQNSDPEWVAYDMLSQAEHDEMAVSILLTTSEDLAKKVKNEITKDIDSGKGRHKIKKASITGNGLIIIVDSIEQAVEFSNRYGPEHLEVMVDNPGEYTDKIKNVGSLFLGRYAPVAVGDYYTGTNHILPTGGAARFSSGTSVDTFLRKTTFQFPTREALKNSKGPVNIMSKVEGLDDKHGGSINIRFKNS